MKIFNKTRGTMLTVPSIEVNKDIVYVRTNIMAINEPNFKGWEYDEIQYEGIEYMKALENKGAMNRADIDYLSVMTGVVL